MELILNLVWLVLAALMLWLWIRLIPCENTGRWTQIIALAVIVLLLLPAISATDDLTAAQNMAEADGCPRKDHVCPAKHMAQLATTDLPLPVASVIHASSLNVPLRDNLERLTVKIPAMASIKSRPPPAA